MTLAVILAGGAGRRMGGNKPFHHYGASTLVESAIACLKPQVEALYINSGHASHPLAPALSGLGLPIVCDEERFAGLGPLSGILTSLALANRLGESHVITIPCDMPNLPPDLVQRLSQAPEAVVAFMAGMRPHPLCARWSSALEPALRSVLAAAPPGAGPSVKGFLATVTTLAVPIDDEQAFVNINSPESS